MTVKFHKLKAIFSNMIKLKNLPNLLTVTEVAKVLRVSNLTIKRWGKKGKLPFIRINSRGDRRFKKSDIIRIFELNEN